MSTIRREQLRSPLSASYALTASYAENANATFNSSSLVTTSSFNAFTASINNFTSSYNTGSFSGSFTGSLSGTASFATSASYALTASYVSNIPTFDSGGLVTTSSFNAFTSSINSFTASYNTGSFTGSFTGSLFGTASWAISASQAVSSSYALTASYIENIPTFDSGNLATTGSNYFLGDQFITGSITTFKEDNYQEIFSTDFTASGDIIKTNKINSLFTTYDLVMLKDNWTVSDSNSGTIQNQLGICLYTDGSEAIILLNGDITVNDNNNGIGPFINRANVGYEVIPSIDNDLGKMTSVTYGLASNGYHRSLGFIYYRNTSNTNNYIMKFNPSNDTYYIIS